MGDVEKTWREAMAPDLLGRSSRGILYQASLSQNEQLTYLWYLNLGCTLRSLGVI